MVKYLIETQLIHQYNLTGLMNFNCDELMNVTEVVLEEIQTEETGEGRVRPGTHLSSVLEGKP